MIFFICLYPDVSNPFGNIISDTDVPTVYVVYDEV